MRRIIKKAGLCKQSIFTPATVKIEINEVGEPCEVLKILPKSKKQLPGFKLLKQLQKARFKNQGDKLIK